MSYKGFMTSPVRSSKRIAPFTPVSQPIVGREREMEKNAAGGYGFTVTDRVLMERMLGIGTEKGTIYQTPEKLTADAAAATIRHINKDGADAIQLILDWSVQGRAVSQSPILFALALASTAQYTPDPSTRSLALKNLPNVARTMSHLQEYVSYVTVGRGWGAGLVGAVQRWFNSKTDEQLAYQALKYRTRNDWSVADLLKSAHVAPTTPQRDALYAYIVKGANNEKAARYIDKTNDPAWELIEAFELLASATTEARVIGLIDLYDVTWEFVPSRWLGSRKVWEALLPNLPLGALVRNLARLTSLGILGHGSTEAYNTALKMTDAKRVRAARIHPIKVFSDFKRYGAGRGDKGSLTWTPNPVIMDALDEMVYLSFPNIVPTGEVGVVGLDLSGSMGGAVNGMSNVTTYEAAGVIGMAFARTEPRAVIMGYDTSIHELNITNRARLGEIVYTLSRTGGGGTDCHLPIEFALKNNIQARWIVNATDSDDWAGTQHAANAIVALRNTTGLPTRMVVCEMQATRTTIGDPRDPLTGRFIGFDANALEKFKNFMNFTPRPSEQAAEESDTRNDAGMTEYDASDDE